MNNSSKPYVLFIHPNDADKVEKCLECVDTEFVIQRTQLVEEGKSILVDRSFLKLDLFSLGGGNHDES
jgi:hypothetical protein